MYKIWNEEDIKEELTLIGKKMGMSCEGVDVVINKRLKNVAGRYIYSSKMVKGKFSIMPISFQFAGFLIDGSYSEEHVRSVIIHEYIHFFTNNKEI